MKRVNIRRIKKRQSYTIEQLAALLSVHVNTIHTWIRNGMPRIDKVYPYMVYGEEAIAYISQQQAKSRMELALEEFLCCRCQAPRRAWNRLADFQPRTSKTAILKALCEKCGCAMNKLVSLNKRQEIETVFDVQAFLPQALVQPTYTKRNC